MRSTPPTASELTLFLNLASAIRTPRLRTLCEFAEQEIVVPDGPYEGRRFQLSRHPVSRLLFQELDSGRWSRAFITGPNQDGKSLLGFVIPTIHLLFERQQTVILGVPSMDLVSDKWTVDLIPVIKASRYRDLLPTKGAGSKEGESVLFEFGNGARLRFMTAGGGDQTRAGFSSPNLVVTETDGFDTVGGSSREGKKLAQLERRALAWGDRARVIAECTVSVEQGITWQEYHHGTRSRIALPCPHCAAWVTPEREHFVGWQEAEDVVAASRDAHLVCPGCGVVWNNEERITANRRGLLVHRGQDVAADGTITGPLPQTDTLGFRWTVANSILDPKRLGKVGGLEWRARRAADEEAAERDVCQSQWALPAKAAKVDVSQLDAFVIMRRTTPKRKGVCPDGTQCVTVGLDIGKRLCHWVAIAWLPNATPHVVDYGRLEPPSDLMAEEEAILIALRDFRDELVSEGWKHGDGTIKPTFVFIDAGNWQDTIINFAIESGPPFFPTKGYGIGQRREGKYKRDTGSIVVWSKEGYSLIRLPDGRHYIEIKADHWKSWVHARWRTPIDKPGAMTLFESNDHLSFAKHQTAEKEVEEFLPKEGMVRRFEAVSRQNHYLDATMLGCVAGHQGGVRLIDSIPDEPSAAPTEQETEEKPNWANPSGNWAVKTW